MRNFIAGFLLGAALFGSVAGYAAYEAKVVGEGHLINVDVMQAGEVVCSDPYYHANTKELECE